MTTDVYDNPVGSGEIPTVPVQLKNKKPIAIRELPTHTSFVNRSIDETGQQVLSRDPHRKIATLISLTQDIYIGENPGDVQNTSGAGQTKWPALTPLVITGNNELYVAAASVSSVADISIVIEVWQDTQDET